MESKNVDTTENATLPESSAAKKSKFLKINKSRRKELIFIIVMLFVPLVHFAVFTVYMNISTIYLSFMKKNYLGEYVFLKNPFQNYTDFFRAISAPYSSFRKAIRNSFVFFLLNDVVVVPLSVILTYVLYKKIAGHKIFRIIFYLPCIISIVVMVMAYRFMFDSAIGVVDSALKFVGLEKWIPENGWIGSKNTALGVVVGYCIWAGLGGNLIVLSSAMSRVSQEIVESAQLDGIGFFQELWYITIPLIGTTLGTLYMFGTTVIFSFFLQPKLITGGGPNGETMTIMMYIVDAVRGDTNDLSGAAAVGNLIAIVGTPLVFITRSIIDKVFPSYDM